MTSRNCIAAFADGREVSFLANSSNELGRGATATVYQIDAGKKYAAKIYNNRNRLERDKILAMMKLSKALPNTILEKLAWPVAEIKQNNRFIGFLMPVVNSDQYRNMDVFFDSVMKKRKLSNQAERDKLTAITNLTSLGQKFAEVMASLHKSKIFVVDLKPLNIKISRKDLSILILDCDGMAIKSDKFGNYSARLISTDYIAPEVTRNKLLPEKLGEDQDRYAMAVLIFQLLNNGIHPFSGVLASSNTNTNTNDEKAASQLYAYGLHSNPKIKPHPQSIHKHFPLELNNLFERAFTKMGANRPSALEWYKYLTKLSTSKDVFQRCSKFPNNPQHIYFRGRGCFSCNSITGTVPVKLETHQSLHGSKKTSITYNTPHSQTVKKPYRAPPDQSEGFGALFWVILATVIVISLLVISAT